ncbi:sodium channel subunit beta-4 isoform X4 [Dromaius novaehollandiae]|uniref:sodium channel subunit beta-4 isoform X4 n=1 Tax=Dromaius novaehollandiae TaxID=8790 RepID=UPI00311EAECE
MRCLNTAASTPADRFAHLLHRPRLGGVGGQDQHRDGSEWLQRPAALRLHHLHRLPGPGLHLIYHGKIKSKASEPFLVGRNPRVEFVGSTTGKDNNISIVLNEVDFSDAGKYTCHVKNPKEKNAQHNASIFLTVVHKMVETDNTVTLIIVGVVGGLIGLLILFMLVKRVVLFIIKKTQDRKKECLVSSSGNDNTENGLPASKAEQKAAPKA